MSTTPGSHTPGSAMQPCSDGRAGQWAAWQLWAWCVLGLHLVKLTAKAGHYKHTAQGLSNTQLTAVSDSIAHHPYIHIHGGLLRTGSRLYEASALTVDCHTSLCIYSHPKRKEKRREEWRGEERRREEKKKKKRKKLEKKERKPPGGHITVTLQRQHCEARQSSHNIQIYINKPFSASTSLPILQFIARPDTTRL